MSDERRTWQGVRESWGRLLQDRTGDTTEMWNEVAVQARKTYVTLVSPRRTFAVVKPAAKRRVDLGLRLAGTEPSGRLERASGVGNDSINLRIGLASVEDIDDEVVGWLRRACAENA